MYVHCTKYNMPTLAVILLVSNAAMLFCCPQSQCSHACICRESAHTHVDNNLPFELKVLEAALTHAVTVMEQDAVKLNQQISPILESLAYKV